MRTYIVLAILVICSVSACVVAEDEDRYISASKDFISRHGSKDEARRFYSKWESMVKTAASSTAEEDEEHFLNRYIFDWMADRKNRFDNKTLTDDDKLQACRIYLIYKNLNGDGTPRRGGDAYSIPSKIAKYLTVENLEKFVAEEKNVGRNSDSAQK